MYGKRPPNSVRSHGQSTFVIDLSSPTSPTDKTIETAKKSAGRRSSRHCRHRKVAAHSSRAASATIRISQAPPVWVNSLVHQLLAPIQLPVASSKNNA